MHPSIKYIFFLLTYLPCALGTPHVSAKKTTDRHTGCHETVGLNHAFIFFHTDTEPDFDFGIITQYHEYYPKALKNALQLDYFRPGYLKSSDECGWHKARSIYSTSWTEFGGHRGDIYWKYSDLHWVQDDKHKNASHWVAASPNHIPPHTGALPRNDTFNNITRILKENEPAADVYQLTTICLCYTCGFLGFLLMVLFARYRVDAPSTSKNTEDPEAIELATINVNSTVKLPSSLRPTATVEVPRNARIGTLEPSGSGQSDPPPQYFVNASNP